MQLNSQYFGIAGKNGMQTMKMNPRDNLADFIQGKDAAASSQIILIMLLIVVPSIGVSLMSLIMS